jgi:hypothetical protein
MADISTVQPALTIINVIRSGHTLRELSGTTHSTTWEPIKLMDKNNFY